MANPGQNENDVSLFDVNSDGTVTEITPRTVVGQLPSVLVMDPAGKYLYVANALSNNISVFSIASSTGELTEIAGSPFNINLPPKNIVIAPSGNYFYVSARRDHGFYRGFQRKCRGVLTALPDPTPTSDNNPTGLTIDPKGTYLYVANTTSSTISVYSIATDGTTRGRFRDRRCRTTMRVRLRLRWIRREVIYTWANEGSNNIGTYSITSGTGFPVAVTDAPFASEGQPNFLAADPNGRYLYVGNQGTTPGVQAFGAASGSLNSIASYKVGNSPTSIAVVQ